MITEVATALGIVAAIVAPMGVLWVLLAPIGLALNGTSSALYAAAGELAHEERQARAFGLFYTVTTAASAAAPIIVGALGDAVDLAFSSAIVAVWVAAATPVALALRSLKRDAPGGRSMRRPARGRPGQGFPTCKPVMSSVHDVLRYPYRNRSVVGSRLPAAARVSGDY